MLDKYIVPIIKPPLRSAADRLAAKGITADQTSCIGFTLGLLTIPLVAMGLSLLALVFLLINRIADGIDGELARLQEPTDAGGFLDITLDFVFYASFPIGFALANPTVNALPAAVLIASFVGTGSSFLAFSSMAEKQNIDHPDFAYKGFYYLNGLAEGTETIICFCLMCLFPNHFATIAWIFTIVCVITTINRIYFGYRTLKPPAGKSSDILQ